MTKRFWAYLPVFRPTLPSLTHAVTLAFVLIMSAAAPSAYAQLNIVFIDTEGNPVEGVVAELQITPATAPQEIGVMDQLNRTFVPHILLIAQGQRVRFPNSDNVRHHVYSFSDAKQFSTPLYADEEVDPILFDQSGIATLGCNIHDSMVAYIYISSWQHRYQSDELGRISLESLSGAEVLHVWHPWLQTTDNRQEVPLSGASNNQLTIELDVRDPSQVFGFRAIRAENS